MVHSKVALLGYAGLASAFPFVADMAGVDSSLFRGPKVKRGLDYDYGTCPFNANHQPAAPFNPKYPYSGAIAGNPGTQVGGILVPAKGDTAHYYTPAGPNDIRGPCPGLNAAANHNFLAHDGVTTFAELVDAQQNVYNVGYDLAVLLATLGVGLDGDPVTQKLSIGCDATSRTSSTLGAGGQEPGLNGHNRFEGDRSLTRNDFFTHGGDNYKFNGTLFEMMRQTTGGVFNRDGLALYQAQRYNQSRAENPNFYYGPKSLLLYGAASFLYELFPSKGELGTPDLATISSFFGTQQDSDGNWQYIGERIPPNWLSRYDPYTIPDVANEIRAQYQEYPVEFGGNIGPNNFDGQMTFANFIKNGTIPDTTTQAAFECFLYMLATENVPSSLSTTEELTGAVVNFTAGMLNPVYKNFGCPLKLNN